MVIRRVAVASAAGLVSALLVAPVALAGSTGLTSRVSVTSGGRQGDNLSGYSPAISADGRFVAFESDATNLVPGDTNNAADVFVRDRLAGVTRRVSLSTNGGQGDGASRDTFGPAISADGRYVAFSSFASNLVPGDTNNAADVFVRDRLLGVTRRVSLPTGGGQSNLGNTLWAMSADGMHVVFTSPASNLVPGDTNNAVDVFVRDRLAGVTSRASLSTGGGQANSRSYYPAISADGRFISFSSDASNLVPGDNNGVLDVFVRDRLTGVTRRVSISTGGRQGNHSSGDASISADGRFVAFSSGATNLVSGDTNKSDDVFVRDRATGVTGRVSVSTGAGQANNWSYLSAISADGRFVAFQSDASNLVPEDSNSEADVFVRDRLAGITRRVSISSSGAQANSYSCCATISADGTHVAFSSFASNLVPGDTNNAFDVFVRDPLLGAASGQHPASNGFARQP